jgi:sugar phosphate isomerase/epimerase
MSRLFSSGLWVFAQSEEKYGGYVGSWTVLDQIKAAASVPGLKGLELIAPLHVSVENVKEVKVWLEDAGLATVAVNPYLWTEPQWQRGALTSPDPKVRALAVDTAKKSIDIGRALGCSKMDLWPGEDGWDYLFQVNYGQMWDMTAECIRKIAEYDPTYQIGIEYKISEPRMNQYISTAAKAALLGAELGLANVGAYLDYGHALIVRENPADSVALLSRTHRLVGVHVNDNYGLEDDDLMVGSVHLWTTLEFLLALEEYGYQDWISLDIVPRRESAVKACTQSFAAMEKIYGMIDRLDRVALAKAQAQMDAVETQRIVYSLING